MSGFFGFCPVLGRIVGFKCRRCEEFESCSKRKLYEYECEKCGWLFDEDDAFVDDYFSRICPKCGSSSTEHYTDVVSVKDDFDYTQDGEGNTCYPEDVVYPEDA